MHMMSTCGRCGGAGQRSRWGIKGQRGYKSRGGRAGQGAHGRGYRAHLRLRRSKRAVPRLFFNSDARSSKYERYTRIVTRGSLSKCDEAVNGLREQARTRFKRRDAYKVEETLDEVAFEMLGDDYEATKRQLDSIRARRTKFVCVNDNVRTMTPALADLFERVLFEFLPFPSSFELPPGQRNRYLRLDAYNAAKRRERGGGRGAVCVVGGWRLRWRPVPFFFFFTGEGQTSRARSAEWRLGAFAVRVARSPPCSRLSAEQRVEGQAMGDESTTAGLPVEITRLVEPPCQTRRDRRRRSGG